MFENLSCRILGNGTDSRSVCVDTAFPRAESATQVLVRRRMSPTPILLWMVLASHSAAAAQLEVQVRDRAGAPLRDVVVTISDGAAVASRSSVQAAMDQVEMRFLPQVMVIPAGGSVAFPNSDSVSHQVYSFSAAKRFQLALYKGSAYPPVRFDNPGLVVLGCNIHDHMVGYIYVTDARWYGMTDGSGKLALPNLPPGTVTITAWSPRIADPPSSLTRHLQIAADDKASLEFRLERPMRNEPEPRPRNPDWDY